MAGTRSARQSENGTSPSTTNGTKRKADEQTSPAHSRRPAKEQKTLEEVIKKTEDKQDAQTNNKQSENADEGFDEEMNNDAESSKQNGNGVAEEQGSIEEVNAGAQVEEPKQKQNEKTNEGNALDQVKADEKDEGTTSKEQANGHIASGAEDEVKEKAIEEDKQREEAQPSNILEKGVIYFFTRGRVGVEEPDSVQDLQRSFFVLRPLAAGAKITDGAVQDIGNNRLIALPKKVFPKSGKDRFMAFVEKEKTTMAALKEDFFSGSSYSTKTTGTRHTPEVTPIGEGVYAITSTGGGQGTSHLAYMLTIPSEVGEVQKDVGLAEKGSFVLSLKNPESSAPSYALPNTAEFPKKFIEEFSGRGWMPVQPKHLDYAGAAFLLIGESFENSNNLEPTPKDEKNGNKETPQEELEKLEEEDEHRVQNLRGDDTVFADLGISSKEYPKVMTTW